VDSTPSDSQSLQKDQEDFELSRPSAAEPESTAVVESDAAIDSGLTESPTTSTADLPHHHPPPASGSEVPVASESAPAVSVSNGSDSIRPTIEVTDQSHESDQPAN